MVNKESSTAINYFNFIRDIPYRIPTSIDEADYSCSGKHKILYQLLKSTKLNVRYRVCEFLWSDFNLPEEFEEIKHANLCTHTYLEVYTPRKRKWIVVDATWDKGLSKLFKINEWDGESNTAIAVKPTKIYSPKKSKEFVETESIDDVVSDLKINRKLYKAINDWLEGTRADQNAYKMAKGSLDAIGG